MAQTEDFGVWTTIGAEKKAGKWNIGSNAELRTKNNSQQTDRWSLQLETSYEIIKQLKAGVSYQFIYYHDTKYFDFQPRNRFSFFLQGKQKFGKFSFLVYEKAQLTTKDASDRIKKSGLLNTYKINPEWIWRNRIKIAYNIPRFPVTPSFSIETFYQLNNPDRNTFDKLRYTLAFSYNLTKHHKFELYGLIDKEINVTNPVKMNITGVEYIYSF
jgi:hypothetical protein